MFELSKHVLQKVSFSRVLFRKELIKAIKFIKPDERLLLYTWCLATFGDNYRLVIMEVFKTVTKSN